MIQESQNEGKSETPDSPISPALYELMQQTDTVQDSCDVPTSPISPSSMFVGPRRAHGLSFQVLQWMTETEDDVDNADEEESMKITYTVYFISCLPKPHNYHQASLFYLFLTSASCYITTFTLYPHTLTAVSMQCLPSNGNHTSPPY